MAINRFALILERQERLSSFRYRAICQLLLFVFCVSACCAFSSPATSFYDNKMIQRATRSSSRLQRLATSTSPSTARRSLDFSRLSSTREQDVEPEVSLSTPSPRTPKRPQAPKSPRKRPRIVTPSAPTSSLRTSAVATTTNSPFTDDEFEDLQVSDDELRPSTTLTTGQCFHWKPINSVTRLETSVTESMVESSDKTKASPTSAWGTHNATEWIGVIRVPIDEKANCATKAKSDRTLVIIIRETPDTTLYRVIRKPDDCEDFDVRSFLWGYFQLDEPLKPLYNLWSKRDARLSRIAERIIGVRILDQDPWECLASFICSSNNNIPRISKILASIRRQCGRLLIPEGTDLGHGLILNEAIYSFPSLKEFSEKATDEDLRSQCGVGYRAKYILETMKLLQTLGGESYLDNLKEKSRTGEIGPQEVQEALIQFSGVGRKVADCVGLFSVKQAEAIPVDVHVWNIACRDYDPEDKLKKVKSLTPTVYGQVGEIFRSRFQEKAGWAHSLLFVAELPSFRPVLPPDLLEEMDKFRAEEQARKKKKASPSS